MDEDEEKLIARYLLGDMESEERDELEIVFFGSDESVEKLEMVRYHLIDRYLAGSLSAAERERFESYLLDSADNREKLRFARTLMTAIEEDEKPSARFSIMEFFRSHNRALIIATSLLILTASFFLFRALLSARPASEPTANSNVTPNTETASETAPITNANQNRSNDDRKKREPRSITATLFLTLVERGREVGESSRLIIDKDTVSVELGLARPAGYKGYTVSIRPVGGEELWSQKLPAGSSAWVTLKIPAKLLSSQDYKLIVLGETDGRTEEIDGYYFGVERKP